jgi:hypothetical protein
MQRAVDPPRRSGANGGEYGEPFPSAARPMGRRNCGRGGGLKRAGPKNLQALPFYAQQIFKITFRKCNMPMNLLSVLMIVAMIFSLPQAPRWLVMVPRGLRIASPTPLVIRRS